jgi:hypothetical protein
MQVVNGVRQLVLHLLDVAQDRYCTIDSLPVLVVQFHLVPGALAEWTTHGPPLAKRSPRSRPFSATSCICWLP